MASPQERKECDRFKEQQEGQDGGGWESKEMDRDRDEQK